ncbi:MAG: hypothetical protein SO314_05475 [Alphaproteobacteria bacterium]|nr:hypothetical protein [Alphaproteobacteria bacterium]
MTRVPTYSTYMNMINQSTNIRDKLNLYSFQASTGLKSPTYAGYGMSAYNIVSLEASLNITQNFMNTNDTLNVEVEVQNTATTAIHDLINDFKSQLLNFSGMDLNNINTDITGGELTFTSGTPSDYVGKTLTINGTTYTFVDDDQQYANVEHPINLQTVIDDAGKHTAEENAAAVMNAMKTRMEADSTWSPDFTIDTEKNKFEFPLYTINGTSTLLNTDSVKMGEAHKMSGDQYQAMQQLQQSAFTTMKAMVDSLNTFANGKYVFGGGISYQAPVNFPFQTLEEFQAYYNGSSVKYPSNAATQLSSWNVNGTQTGSITLERDDALSDRATITANGGSFLTTKVTAGAEATGNLLFDADDNTIKASQYGAFNSLSAGDTLVIDGTDAEQNAKAYVIKSVSADGKTITVEDTNGGIAEDMDLTNGGNLTFSSSFPVGSVVNMDGFGTNVSPQVQVTGISDDGTQLYVTVDTSRFPANGAAQTFPADGKWSMNSESYYQGGNLSSEQRISENQSITMDITAADPAFEKLFRALGEIAQGNLTTALDPTMNFDGVIDFDNTADRAENALTLISDGLFNGGKSSSQSNSDLYTIQAKIDSHLIILNQTAENQKIVKTNLENSITSLKSVDKEEAATLALLASYNLQASYAVMQMAMSNTILDYL